jgi:Zn-finger nucleic acid-binding protein
MAWDSDEIRKEREYGWFREHEKDLIEAAKRRRLEAEKARADAAAAADRAVTGRCPRCGTPLQTSRIEEVEVDKCPSCEGIFFDRGELETVLLRHDAHRRGFFRKLLGFHGEPESAEKEEKVP